MENFKPVSSMILSKGISFKTFRFSSVFKEQPLIPFNLIQLHIFLKILPTYKSNSKTSLSSRESPVKECTTPVGNLLRFCFTISSPFKKLNIKNGRYLLLLAKSPFVLRLCKYIGNLYFSAKSK